MKVSIIEILKYFGLDPSIVKKLTQGQCIKLINLYYSSIRSNKIKVETK